MSDEREFVIGRAMAAALEADRQRTANHGQVPSPLPDGGERPWHDQAGLLRITPLPYDDALAGFARHFRASSPELRAGIRNAVSLDDGYTLMAFARRSAVFALRSRSPQPVIDGLSACSAIALERVDQRDVLRVLACLHCAAAACGTDPAASLAEAAVLGGPTFEALALSFLRRSSTMADLRDTWGLVEVDGPYGLGLLEWGFAPWAPTLDLVGTSLRVAAGLRGGDYAIDDPNLAVKLPAVWLSQAGDQSLGPSLDAARGATAINGHMLPMASPDHVAQQLVIWLVELDGDEAAERLVRSSLVPHSGHTLLGLADGPLFVLLVARSAVEGVPAVEDQGSVARFEPQIASALMG